MTEIAFLSEIDKEAASQEGAILRQAEAKRLKILQEAQQEADRLEAVFSRRTDLEIKKHQGRLLTQSDLDHRQKRLALKTAFVRKALEGARKEWDGLSPNASQDILKKLLSELIESLEGEPRVVVRVHPRDQKAAEDLLKERRISFELKTDPAVSRGVEIEDKEGYFRVRNTFETRLQKAHGEVIQHLNRSLLKGV